MNFGYRFMFLRSVGIVGRFLIAMILLLVLKSLNKNDIYIDNGIKWLIILGGITFSLCILFMVFGAILFNSFWLIA